MDIMDTTSTHPQDIATAPAPASWRRPTSEAESRASTAIA
jgi:hypothetical protein